MGFERNGIGVLEEHTARNRVRVFLGGETSFVFFCTPLDCFSINQCGAANRLEVGNASFCPLADVHMLEKELGIILAPDTVGCLSA